jgi:putative acyl-CoA dehydrogenase
VQSGRNQSIETFFSEVQLAKSGDRRLNAYIEQLKSRLRRDLAECDCRLLTEQLAMVLQASLLVRHSPSAIADAFCSSRLTGDWGHAFGTLPSGTKFREIIDRAWG